MDRRSLRITIPAPCHEQWSDMTATDQGAFCHSCQKVVVDFTRMTDEELIHYLQQGTPGCGKFRTEQLDTPPVILPPANRLRSLWKTALTILLPFLGIKSGYAQAPASGQHIQHKAAVSHRKDTTITEPVVLDEVTVGSRRKHEVKTEIVGALAIVRTPEIDASHRDSLLITPLPKEEGKAPHRRKKRK
ncbi:MAG: hypothetical protein JSS76_08030 [Bacteroidetes bacterium]|nr:hypothetical protein [Bacteroidota bacterium]